MLMMMMIIRHWFQCCCFVGISPHCCTTTLCFTLNPIQCVCYCSQNPSMMLLTSRIFVHIFAFLQFNVQPSLCLSRIFHRFSVVCDHTKNENNFYFFENFLAWYSTKITCVILPQLHFSHLPFIHYMSICMKIGEIREGKWKILWHFPLTIFILFYKNSEEWKCSFVCAKREERSSRVCDNNPFLKKNSWSRL